ncbi:MAG: MATE family efflux transporter, partial [Oscillospiraceae bacterium]|nr:MATE family efflux transporter [Oscillospiraceae bacterium]
MNNKDAALSQKDTAFRNFSLTGNMWRVLLNVGAPLALYQSLNQLFKILDSMMASHISAESVSAVAYLSQINLMLSAVGGGLAIGASLKISEAYGAGDYQLVQKRVSTLFAMCTILGCAILFGILPFTTSFLRLAGTPEELITIGAQYFAVDLFGMVIGFLGNVYIAIERARGNSKRILHLNLVAIAVKLVLTALFVYVLHGTITHISIATVISQFILVGAAIINLRQKGNVFGFSFKHICFKHNVAVPMVTLSIPVIAERIAFTFGKV